MQNHVVGLCGHYTGSTTDEYFTPGGQVVDNYADFGNYWLDPLEPRAIEPVSNQATHPCSLLSSTQVRNCACRDVYGNLYSVFSTQISIVRQTREVAIRCQMTG